MLERGNWNGIVKYTISGQAIWIRVVSSAIWKNVVTTLSRIIFALLDATKDEYHPTRAKERNEPLRMIMLAKLSHSVQTPLLSYLSLKQFLIEQVIEVEFPLTHSEHDDAPSAVVVPAPHALHSFLDLDPDLMPYRPAGQSAQSPSPGLRRAKRAAKEEAFMTLETVAGLGIATLSVEVPEKDDNMCLTCKTLIDSPNKTSSPRRFPFQHRTVCNHPTRLHQALSCVSRPHTPSRR